MMWPTKYLNDLDQKCRAHLKWRYKKIDPDEFEHRVIWRMFDEMMKKNFQIDIQYFIESIPEKYFTMMPITIKKEQVESFERFLLIIQLENDRRTRISTDRYSKVLICLTWALVGIGIATILVTFLPFIMK